MSEEHVSELLAPLASTEVDLPHAESVYWRARVQQVLENERDRRAEALRPLRLLYLLLATSALAAALAILPFSTALGPLAVPLSAASATLGAALLTQTATGRLR